MSSRQLCEKDLPRNRKGSFTELRSVLTRAANESRRSVDDRTMLKAILKKGHAWLVQYEKEEKERLEAIEAAKQVAEDAESTVTDNNTDSNTDNGGADTDGE